jgi:hypothetical protein
MKLTEEHKLMLFLMLADSLQVNDKEGIFLVNMQGRKDLYMDILSYQDEIIEDKDMRMKNWGY